MLTFNLAFLLLIFTKTNLSQESLPIDNNRESSLLDADPKSPINIELDSLEAETHVELNGKTPTVDTEKISSPDPGPSGAEIVPNSGKESTTNEETQTQNETKKGKDGNRKDSSPLGENVNEETVTISPELAKTETQPKTEEQKTTIEEEDQSEGEDEKPEDSDSQEQIHKTDSFLLQVQLGLLLVTILTGHYLRTRKIVRIHETGLAILYGLIAGGIILLTLGLHGVDEKHQQLIVEPAKCDGNNITTAERNLLVKIKNNYYGYKLLDAVTPESASILFELEKISFDPEIFFHLLLPPIIFYAAYSMRKRHFFRNISTILTFAFVGTLIATFVTATVVFFFVKIGHAFGELKTFRFNDCLYFGAIISATDPVTVLAVFKEKSVDVDLDAILFGESILNDAVAIVLAGAIKANSDASEDDDKETTHVGGIILSFFGVFLGSFLIGSCIATINALFFKYLPFVTEPIMETAIFVMASWSAFLTAESLGCSGIVAVLFAGILQAQYTYRNLSKLGQTLTKEFFHLLAFVSENFVFCYMGLTITQAAKQVWSFWFILGSFVGIVVGRAANIYPLSWLLNLSGRKTGVKHLPMPFQHMMMWSGLRGAMAFALAIRDTITNKEQIIFTTTLMICYLTVWILGSGSSIALEKLKIQVGVDPDADLSTPGSYHQQNYLFKLWHKIDKSILRPILTTNLYGEDCSPVMSPEAGNTQGMQAGQNRLNEFRRNSSNFSSVNDANTTGFEMNQAALNIASQLEKQQNINIVRSGQSISSTANLNDHQRVNSSEADSEIILHDGSGRVGHERRRDVNIDFE